MYEILFYENKNGKCQIIEHLVKLKLSNTKENISK